MNVHLGDPGQLADLHIALLLNGVYATPRGMINLSTALSPGDLDDIAAAYAAAFTQVRRARLVHDRGQKRLNIVRNWPRSWNEPRAGPYRDWSPPEPLRDRGLQSGETVNPSGS